MKIGAKVVRHGRYVISQMAEVAVSEEFPGNLAADRGTATKTGSSVGTEGVGCVITTGGVCLNDEEKNQIGFSGMVRAAATPEAVRTPPYGFCVPQQNARLAFVSIGWGLPSSDTVNPLPIK
ncbi:hypothetical protein FNL55_05765 [Tardiphaga sp. vice352]|uniref:hypothetical protein n=1 Tax=Tardiphaga sp. vice352 TaxID=2592816 RepID=UPI0011622F01|nr:MULTISPECIES: hypothetical protein [unclassified Tardiphaga]QDM15515.1 hypothetical protein FNL53_05925 [Tardiphaga sp. vice278]QDM20544.1 hypothetical protein FIU28_04845 [Tardiphaga sp. vice154]QDM25672.1 hypothetical protein FNL56_05675 [Tardiphaga sp. vice304]QDM30885.1 hypothetical protein FNL55_05765 [Tardiphaga sp. vice352]